MSAYDFTRPVAELIREAKARRGGTGLRQGIVPKKKGAYVRLDPVSIPYRHLVLLQDAANEELKRQQVCSPMDGSIDCVVAAIDEEVSTMIRLTVPGAARYKRFEVLDGWYAYGCDAGAE